MKRVLLMAVTAFMLSGCFKTKDPEQNCNYDECKVKAPATEIQAVKDYLAQKNIQATEHCSGVLYAIDSVGTGQSPTICSMISFRYKGMLTNGTVFDKSETAIQSPLGNLVLGWVNTLPKIKPGGGMRIYIPPTLGYGARDVKDANGNVVIPANSIIVFEVKLDGVVL